MNSSNEVVKVETLPLGILHIILNRPEQLNALSQQVLERLDQLLSQAKNDPQVKGVLLSGSGKAFCAGADIKQLAALDGPQGIQFARFGQKVFRSLELLGKPSVAAIHGYAFGGGCELAMSATLRVSSDNTVFGQPEIKLGVIPGFGGTQRLARLIGKGRALDICLTGRRFTAVEAFQWGLVNETTTPEKTLERAKELLSELAKLGPVALASIMTTIHQGYDLTLEDGFELEASHFGLCCTTADKAEGVAAFLEKREAVFSGA